LLGSVASQVLSFRRSSGERRQQLKLLASGSALAVAGIFSGIALSGRPGIVGVVASIAGDAAWLALPACMGVAILRYRLFDIDRIISRTLAYAIVTGLLIGLYAALVLVATQVLRFHSTVTVAAATLAAAALFTPLRRRVQRLVDRRFNRARYDADRTVAAFAAQLKDALDPGSVRDDLIAVVDNALEPAHVSVWINNHGTHPLARRMAAPPRAVAAPGGIPQPVRASQTAVEAEPVPAAVSLSGQERLHRRALRRTS
jgi:hypothetical protein